MKIICGTMVVISRLSYRTITTTPTMPYDPTNIESIVAMDEPATVTAILTATQIVITDDSATADSSSSKTVRAPALSEPCGDQPPFEVLPSSCAAIVAPAASASRRRISS
jgi:hypothetical protein